MRIQFYAPHPDDVEIFCGGTLLKHYYHHHQIQVLIMTRGEMGAWCPWCRGKQLALCRTRETWRRYRLLQDVTITWLEFQDSRINPNRQSIALVEAQLVPCPDIIYLPQSAAANSVYRHPDHLATARIVELAVAQHPGRTILRYYHSRRINLYINVSAYFWESQQALRCYRSQYYSRAYPPFLLSGVSMLRRFCMSKMGRRIRCRYAEGFEQKVINDLEPREAHRHSQPEIWY